MSAAEKRPILCVLGFVCRNQRPAEGLLTLINDKWAAVLPTVEDQPDTIEVCAVCAADWLANNRGSATFRRFG